MQFRKGLVAAATAAAVMSTGAVAVQAQETTTTAPTTTTSKPADKKTTKPTTTATKKPNPAKPTIQNDNNKNKKDGSSVKDMSPAEIRDWIAVFTAVIGALGTLFAFLDKYMRP